MTAVPELAIADEGAADGLAGNGDTKHDRKIPLESTSAGGNNSVVLAEKVQSFYSGNSDKTTEKQKAKTADKNDDDNEDWRFEIKRKRRAAERKNSGSTAKEDWYYWVIRIKNQGKSEGDIMYYGTLDILEEDDPKRLQKYWKRSKARKNGRPGK